MNKTVAGGVVADAEFWADRLDMLKDVHGCGSATMQTSAELLRSLASDLESCQQKFEALEFSYNEMCATASQACAELSATRDALTAAQAEADRLQTQYRWLCDNLATVNALMESDQYATPKRCVEALMPIDAAIHAAKTEQERGE